MIVYGIEGKQNDVDSVVYDALCVVDKGKMVMQTDLALNNHHMQGVEYNKILGAIRFYHSGSKPFNEKDLSSSTS